MNAPGGTLQPPPYNPPVTPKRNWFFRHKVLTTILVLWGLAALGRALPSNDSTPRTNSPATSGSASPATLQDALNQELGGDQVILADVTDESVLVKFNVSDNLTENLIRVGVQKDVRAILKVLHAKHPGIHVTVSGQFPLVDKYGKESVGQVVLLNYSAETLAKINYDAAGLDVVALADSSPRFVHPDFGF